MIAFLSPGSYQLRVSTGATPDAVPQTGDYQPQEICELELFVASRLEVNFALTLSDTWKSGIAQGLYQQGATAIIHLLRGRRRAIAFSLIRISHQVSDAGRGASPWLAAPRQ